MFLSINLISYVCPVSNLPLFCRSVRIAEEVKRKQETLMHSLAAREVERKKHIEEAEEVIRQTKVSL